MWSYIIYLRKGCTTVETSLHHNGSQNIWDFRKNPWNFGATSVLLSSITSLRMEEFQDRLETLGLCILALKGLKWSLKLVARHSARQYVRVNGQVNYQHSHQTLNFFQILSMIAVYGIWRNLHIQPLSLLVRELETHLSKWSVMSGSNFQVQLKWWNLYH